MVVILHCKDTILMTWRVENCSPYRTGQIKLTQLSSFLIRHIAITLLLLVLVGFYELNNNVYICMMPLNSTLFNVKIFGKIPQLTLLNVYNQSSGKYITKCLFHRHFYSSAENVIERRKQAASDSERQSLQIYGRLYATNEACDTFKVKYLDSRYSHTVQLLRLRWNTPQ